MIQPFILPLDAAEASLATVGGKGANLARLARAGFPVPGGFLITTAAYHAYVTANHLQAHILETVNSIQPDDPAALESASRAIRERFGDGAMPVELVEPVRAAYAGLGSPPVAVRSSATAEDLPDMSFAGQQDTYLNVVGPEALLKAVVNCWSSLWTARAIGYRARNGIPHADVFLSVVVQEMVQSEVSGVLFTANPLSGRRSETVIDATLGLGEALVSGQVEPDHYVVDTAGGRILEKQLGSKALAIRGEAGGGTATVSTDAADRQALPDAAIRELADLGQQVAAHFGFPQDIEWAWANGKPFLLQSRPITSLYPIPAGLPAEPLQVLFSFGAIQGLLEPMTPLGQDTIRGVFAGIARQYGYPHTLETQRIIYAAGERLWANISAMVHNRLGRRLLRAVLPAVEPGTAHSLEPLWADPQLAHEGGLPRPITLYRLARLFLPFWGRVAYSLWRPDVSRDRFQRYLETTVATFQERNRQAGDLAEQLAIYEEMYLVALGSMGIPRLAPRVAAGVVPLRLLYNIAADLARTDPAINPEMALEVTRGLPHNVTTEMDLALWSVARVIRTDPASAAHFARRDAAALAEDYQAGRLPYPAQVAVAAFLDRYGVRGVGEIDLGRPRWRENPAHVMQILHSYLRIEPDQAPDVVFERGKEAAERAVERLAAAAARSQGGRFKVRMVRWLARRVRALTGLRESPKFTIIRLMGIVRAGLLERGRELVAEGVLARPEDLFFLRVRELQAIAAGDRQDRRALVQERRQLYEREKLRRQIPRLLFGDGRALYEGLGAVTTRDGVITGSPVSPGMVEGVVHVVLDPHGAQLAPGEILVCPGTDPAWTPLFLAAGGLVMEVGGLMTHGSVVAREYGIPAVVGVDQATRRLRSGQRIRVDGSAGRIVLLSDDGSQPVV